MNYTYDLTYPQNFIHKNKPNMTILYSISNTITRSPWRSRSFQFFKQFVQIPPGHQKGSLDSQAAKERATAKKKKTEKKLNSSSILKKPSVLITVPVTSTQQALCIDNMLVENSTNHPIFYFLLQAHTKKN